MNKSQIEAVVFDFAGVVFTDSFWEWANQHIDGVAARRPEIESLSRRLDLGEISFDDLTRVLARTDRPPETIQPEIIDLTAINHELLDYIRQLREHGYKIGALSNGSGQHVRRIFALNDIVPTDYFNHLQISSECGIIKPDPKAFVRILGSMGVAAERTIFIDDRQDNIEGAQRVGMVGLLFVNTEQLVRDMEALGIKW